MDDRYISTDLFFHPFFLIDSARLLHATLSEDRAVILEVCERPKLAPRKHSSQRVQAGSSCHTLLVYFNLDMAKRHRTVGSKGAHCTYLLIPSTHLWAIILRGSSEHFVHQCLKSKFMDALEADLTSRRISPVVREGLLDVLTATAHAKCATP